METESPLVSVLMITFNDEPFIRDAISSVLAQTVDDFELIVLDDGSIDATERAAREFSDPRVRYVRQTNQGPSAAVNAAVALARGEFIAFTNGDGLSRKERLASQLEAHRRTGAGVVFCNAEYIDERGMPATDAYWPKDLFCIPPLTRGQIVERFFFQGNFFPTFNAFLPRRLFLAAGPFDPLLWQLADFDHLCRLIDLAEFTVLPDALTSWRLRAGDGNLSSPTLEHHVRTNIEMYLIGRRMLENISTDLFVEAFSTRFRNLSSRSAAEFECERAFLHAGNQNSYARIIGAERLYTLLRDSEMATLLATRFEFTERDFVELLKGMDVMNFSLANDLRALTVERVGLLDEVAKAADEIASLTRRLESNEAELQQLKLRSEAELHQLKVSNEAEVQLLKAQSHALLTELYSSKSWRFTRPLRLVGRAMSDGMRTLRRNRQ